MPSRERGRLYFISYIQSEGRSQGMLFPVVLDDLVQMDHVCRVMDLFGALQQFLSRYTPKRVHLSRRDPKQRPPGTKDTKGTATQEFALAPGAWVTSRHMLAPVRLRAFAES